MDYIQEIIYKVSADMQKEQTTEMMTLGKLIEQLEKVNPEYKLVCSTIMNLKLWGFDIIPMFVNSAIAEKAMIAAKWNYDDILSILEKQNNHKWGSDADRKQRKQDINKVIDFVSLNINLFL